MAGVALRAVAARRSGHHYLATGSAAAECSDLWLVIVAIVCLGLGLFGIIQASTVRLGWLRASLATGLLIAIAAGREGVSWSTSCRGSPFSASATRWCSAYAAPGRS
jgi:hypothetical protein